MLEMGVVRESKRGMIVSRDAMRRRRRIVGGCAPNCSAGCLLGVLESLKNGQLQKIV